MIYQPFSCCGISFTASSDIYGIRGVYGMELADECMAVDLRTNITDAGPMRFEEEAFAREIPSR